MLTTDGVVDPIGLRAVERLISEEICGAADYRQETASTNALALADLRAESVHEHCPKLYLADSQTAGRGRHGRSWVSTAGTLTFSLVVDRSLQTHRSTKLLSLAVGIGIARSLEYEFAPLQARLKWPNDVYISGGKVAGILLETTQHSANRVVIGVGLNASDSPDLFDESTAVSARNLATAVGRDVHRYQLLHPTVVSIVRTIDEMDQFSDDLIDQFRSRCLLTNQLIGFQAGDLRCEGICRGVTNQGDLIVETPTGVRHLQSGEAQLVRKRSRD